MSQMEEPKRFRVALSFPGEHRARVARIAEVLAVHLGRDKILYDKWHAAEFNRPNLDTYLARLYHDESDIIVVFLCQEYNAKDWCGLEWRACRDLLNSKEDDKLMFFRLDSAAIPGLYSIDGYQDISTMTDAEAASAILGRLGDKSPKVHRHFKAMLLRERAKAGTVVALALVALALVAVVRRAIISIVDRSPFEIQSGYVNEGSHKKDAAVVFVHGIFGTKHDTWTNRGSTFPALLASDPEFEGLVDVFVFEYFTPRFGNAASIVSLADQLRGSLDGQRVFEDHRSVIFLSHSMGGLVVREFLLTKRDRLAKVPMLYFYATPTNGSELTSIAEKVSDNPQLRGMVPLEGNDLLQSIQSNWLGWDAVKRTPSYCAYETLPTYGIFVVSMSSATALCNQDLDPIAANHIEIVKPKDRADPRYSDFATALRRSGVRPPTRENGVPSQQKMAVAVGWAVGAMGQSTTTSMRPMFDKSIESLGLAQNDVRLLSDRFFALESKIRQRSVDYDVAQADKTALLSEVQAYSRLLSGEEHPGYMEFGLRLFDLSLTLEYWERLGPDRNPVEASRPLLAALQESLKRIRIPEGIAHEIFAMKPESLRNASNREASMQTLAKAAAAFDLNP
jgi:pimeloyl-ACP methyl ester carboxylesterase